MRVAVRCGDGGGAARRPAGEQVGRQATEGRAGCLAAKKLDEALAKVKEAQGAAGEKTAYDNYVMNILLFQIYQQKQDMDDAIPVLQQAAQSQYATPEQQKLWLKNIALYYFQQKDYAKALDTAEQAVKHGCQ